MSTNRASEHSKQFQIAVRADRQYSADATRALLSTILFHRLFGSLAPSTGEAVGITYPVAGHPETESLLLERSKELTRKFRDSSVKELSVRIQFFTQKVKSSAWFAKTRSVCWESWNVDITVNPIDPNVGTSNDPLSADYNPRAASRDTPRAVTSRELQRALLEVVYNADSFKDHIPPITTTDVSPFQYEVTII